MEGMSDNEEGPGRAEYDDGAARPANGLRGSEKAALLVSDGAWPGPSRYLAGGESWSGVPGEAGGARRGATAARSGDDVTMMKGAKALFSRF